MGLLTEADVRRMSDGGKRGPVVVERGQVLTPSARDWLSTHKIQVVHPQGEGEGRYRTLFGATLTEKPEHMTHLRGNVLVFKDHLRIAFRGYIDLLEGELLLCQQVAAGERLTALVDELEQVLAYVRGLIRCDVLDEPLGETPLCGYDENQLRDYSHHPEQHLGQPHFLPHYTDGPALLALNRVRTVVRQTELAAYRAFRDGDGNAVRGDIIRGLNRLSSLLWILMIKRKAGAYGAH